VIILDKPDSLGDRISAGARSRGRLASPGWYLGRVVDPLPSAHRAAALEAKGALRARFGDRLRSTILFGSRAWGEPRGDSDVDLCVVVDGLEDAERAEVMDVVARVAVERDVPLSPLVWSAEQLERYLAIEYRLAEDITRRGVAL
jgi:predicted nucleotidyltransferase